MTEEEQRKKTDQIIKQLDDIQVLSETQIGRNSKAFDDLDVTYGKAIEQLEIATVRRKLDPEMSYLSG